MPLHAFFLLQGSEVFLGSEVTLADFFKLVIVLNTKINQNISLGNSCLEFFASITSKTLLNDLFLLQVTWVRQDITQIFHLIFCCWCLIVPVLRELVGIIDLSKGGILLNLQYQLLSTFGSIITLHALEINYRIILPSQTNPPANPKNIKNIKNGPFQSLRTHFCIHTYQFWINQLVGDLYSPCTGSSIPQKKGLSDPASPQWRNIASSQINGEQYIKILCNNNLINCFHAHRIVLPILYRYDFCSFQVFPSFPSEGQLESQFLTRSHNNKAMQDGKPKCNIKLLTILSLAASAAILALLAAIMLCGFQGFDRQAGTIQNNPSYFWKKFQKEPKVVFGARLLSVALAACCLLGQNVVVVRSYYRQKELQQNSSNINFTRSQSQINSCFILTSLAILFLLPASLFYLLLNFEQAATYTWLLTCLGLLALILTIVIVAVFIRLAVHSDNQQLPKAESAVDECERMQDIFTMKVSQIGQKEEKYGDLKTGFDIEGAAQIYETIKIYKQSQQKRNEQPITNNGIPLYAELFTQFQEPKKTNESARKERDALKKNARLAEIQRRKKKFRDVNPLKEHVIEEKSEEESSEIEDNDYPKLTNLPKSYRQYIKESKRPARKIILNAVPEAPITAEEKINNKLENADAEQSLRAKANYIKEPATSKEGELVYQKMLRSKHKRERKVLFEEMAKTTGQNGTEQTEQIEDESSKKKQKKKDPSKEEALMQILKRKYSEDQQ